MAKDDHRDLISKTWPNMSPSERERKEALMETTGALWVCRHCRRENPFPYGECIYCGKHEDGVGRVDVRQSDPVKQPAHYASFEIEPVEFVSRNKLDFLRGNAIKYLCRAFLKGGAEDLKKALRYVQMALEHHYGVHVPIHWKEEREVEGLNWNLKGGNR